jgi:PQQ-dependent catabolism-associated CXXCW motif protein
MCRRREAELLRRPASILVRGTLLALGLLIGVAADPAYAPEPAGFWTGPMQGAVPATLAGGTVIHTEDLRALLRRGDVVLVDVAPMPRRPEGLAADALWAPPPHRSIPGSVWLPDVGRGEIEPAYDVWFRGRLAELTGGNQNAPVVIYCHPHCWASWNAAKRAIGYGYRQVSWYPDGAEGWQDADLPTVTTSPELPPS